MEEGRGCQFGGCRLLVQGQSSDEVAQKVLGGCYEWALPPVEEVREAGQGFLMPGSDNLAGRCLSPLSTDWILSQEDRLGGMLVYSTDPR